MTHAEYDRYHQLNAKLWRLKDGEALSDEEFAEYQRLDAARLAARGARSEAVDSILLSMVKAGERPSEKARDYLEAAYDRGVDSTKERKAS